MNGVLAASGVASDGPSSALTGIDIGRWSSSGYHRGSIDAVRIYNKALSASEVLALYNQGK